MRELVALNRSTSPRLVKLLILQHLQDFGSKYAKAEVMVCYTFVTGCFRASWWTQQSCRCDVTVIQG